MSGVSKAGEAKGNGSSIWPEMLPTKISRLPDSLICFLANSQGGGICWQKAERQTLKAQSTSVLPYFVCTLIKVDVYGWKKGLLQITSGGAALLGMFIFFKRLPLCASFPPFVH